MGKLCHTQAKPHRGGCSCEQEQWEAGSNDASTAGTLGWALAAAGPLTAPDSP